MLKSITLGRHPSKPSAGENPRIQSFRALVDRVAASELFQKAPRLREFLLYAAESTLENRLQELREQVIAERVFGRKPEFQGAQDNIVRADARNLRKRLETYFETEGKDEPVLVLMPKGGYSLAFEPRDSEPAALAPVPVPAPHPRSLPYLCTALGLVAALASALAIYWHSADSHLRDQLKIARPELPFSALLSDEQDALIVTSDTGLLQISSLAHRRITLDEYMARTYPNVPNTQPPDLIRNWNVYEFTDGREMAIAGSILRTNAQYAQRITLRSGHAVQLQDFKDHNTVLIGSPISNPWAQLYEDKLNFPCSLAETGYQILFRDRAARGHEPAQYPNADDIEHDRSYARLAFLPRVSDVAATLLIAGTTAQSTQTAGELVVDRERMAQVLRSIGLDPTGPPHYFEILIRSNKFVAGAILPEVVAWRLSPAAAP